MPKDLDEKNDIGRHMNDVRRYTRLSSTKLFENRVIVEPKFLMKLLFGSDLALVEKAV